MGKISKLIYMVGAYQISIPFYNVYKYHVNNHEREKRTGISNEFRIKDKYNANGESWALVTGSSEGIGREYALNLAKSKFNIILASRNTAKNKDVELQIKRINPWAKVKIVTLDLSATSDFSAISDDEEVMNNLTLVVNNAGLLLERHFFKHDPQSL